MKLDSIQIKNFKCFESFKISFTPKTTIIIGRNGAGKSTLLSAIKMAISFVFSNNKSLGKDFLSAGNPSLNILSFADSDYRYDSEKGTTAPDASINAVASYNQQRLEWELYSVQLPMLLYIQQNIKTHFNHSCMSGKRIKPTFH